MEDDELESGLDTALADEPNPDEELPQDGEAREGQEGEGGDGANGDKGEEDVIQIGDEEPPASEETKAAPAWVKELRQSQRELKRENAELKAKLGAGQPATKAKPELPPKPTLAACEYDEDAYAARLDEWHAKKRDIDREVEAQEVAERQQAEARQRQAQTVNEHYAATKKALKVRDFQEAEDEVVMAFSEVQQAIVKAGATNPALLVYAAGKNPKRLQELASIKDPVKFAVAIGKLETEVKVTKRTGTKPAPETTVRGGSAGPTTKATLERLEAEADRTGDRSKVIAYKRAQRAKGK